MLLKGPKVSSTHTHTHTQQFKPFVEGGGKKKKKKKLDLNYTQDLKQRRCLPGTAFDSASHHLLPSSLGPLPPPPTPPPQCLLAFRCLAH